MHNISKGQELQLTHRLSFKSPNIPQSVQVSSPLIAM